MITVESHAKAQMEAAAKEYAANKTKLEQLNARQLVLQGVHAAFDDVLATLAAQPAETAAVVAECKEQGVPHIVEVQATPVADAPGVGAS